MSRGKHAAAAAKRRAVAESERTFLLGSEIASLKKQLHAATVQADRVPGLLAEVKILKADLAATEGPKVAEIRRWHEERVTAADAEAEMACDLIRTMLAAWADAEVTIPVIPETHMEFVKVHNLLPANNRRERRARANGMTAADFKEHESQDNRKPLADNLDRARGLTL